MKLDKNAHSVFLLDYHVVFVVKYRRKVFDNNISERAKEIFEHISPKYNIVLEEWNHDEDHVHILFRAHPKTEISKFINAYKSASSRLLKKRISKYTKKVMERTLLESKFLFTNNRRGIDRCNKKIYRKPRR